MCSIQSELAGGFRGVLERAMRVGSGSLHLNGGGTANISTSPFVFFS